MTRRENSLFEDVADITSKFPWWVGVLLAVVAYLLLHSDAGKELTPVTTSGVNGIFNNVLPGLLHVLAYYGQIVLPVAFLLGSIASVILRFKRTRLYDKTSRLASHDFLGNMSWQDFEFLVGEFFRRRHFSVEETRAGADGGIDLIAKKGMEKYLVQCKHWKAYKVGVKIVRELLGVMVGVGATGGFVVTSGEFTKDAIDFAKANNIKLLDGRELLSDIKSFASYDSQLGKKDGNLQKIMLVFIGLLFFVVCYFYLYHDLKNTQTSLPVKKAEQKDSRVTDYQVKRSMEEALGEKKSEQLSNIKTSQKGEVQKYLYEIELVSGGRISTGNVTITDKGVGFVSDKGLIVTLNREDVKSMKKIKFDK